MQHLSSAETIQSAKICSVLVTDAAEDLTAESTEAQVASSLDDACTKLNEAEGVDCQSFLDAHEDKLVPLVRKLGDDVACQSIEVCTGEKLGDAHDAN